MVGSLHVKKQYIYNFLQKRVSGMLKCLVCNIEMQTPQKLDWHLASALHAKSKSRTQGTAAVAVPADVDDEVTVLFEGKVEDAPKYSEAVPAKNLANSGVGVQQIRNDLCNNSQSVLETSIEGYLLMVKDQLKRLDPEDWILSL